MYIVNAIIDERRNKGIHNKLRRKTGAKFMGAAGSSMCMLLHCHSDGSVLSTARGIQEALLTNLFDFIYSSNHMMSISQTCQTPKNQNFKWELDLEKVKIYLVIRFAQFYLLVTSFSTSSSSPLFINFSPVDLCRTTATD